MISDRCDADAEPIGKWDDMGAESEHREARRSYIGASRRSRGSCDGYEATRQFGKFIVVDNKYGPVVPPVPRSVADRRLGWPGSENETKCCRTARRIRRSLRYRPPGAVPRETALPSCRSTAWECGNSFNRTVSYGRTVTPEAEEYDFVCPECAQEIEVNASMREALLANGCVVCGAALSPDAFC